MSLHEDRLRALTRLFVIATTLQNYEKVTLADLAAACNCSRRQITRDLSNLHEAGVAYHYDKKRKSYVLLEPLARLTVSFSLPDIMAVAMTQEVMQSQGPLLSTMPSQTVFDRIAALIPANLRAELEVTQHTVQFETEARRDYTAAPWKVLIDAARTRQTLEMIYYTISRDSIGTRNIDPYHVIWRQGYWHLVAYCHSRTEVLLFALDCIRGLRPTGDTFEIPKNFSLADYLKGSVGVLRGNLTAIAVRFEPKIARWAKRRQWNFPHELTTEEDGAVVLRGTVSGLEEIRKEILQWGANVTVLEPPELRASVLAVAQDIAAKYAHPLLPATDETKDATKNS